MATITHHEHPGPAGRTGHHHQTHRLPLGKLFLALTAFTAAEVAIFETWSRVEAVHDALPKFALVLLILVFTLPKAYIVLVYFMHLRFERQLVVALALLPFLAAVVAVLPTLTDIRTLKGQGRALNQDHGLSQFELSHGGHGDDAHGSDAHGDAHGSDAHEGHDDDAHGDPHEGHDDDAEGADVSEEPSRAVEHDAAAE